MPTPLSSTRYLAQPECQDHYRSPSLGGPNLPDTWPNMVDWGQVWLLSGHAWSSSVDFVRIWLLAHPGPLLADCGPVSIEFGPISAERRSSSAEFGPSVVDPRPMLAASGQTMIDSGRFREEFGRSRFGIRVEIRRIRRNFGRNRPKFGGFRAIWADARRCCPRLGTFGPTGVGRRRPRFDQIPPNVDATFGRLPPSPLPNSGKHRPAFREPSISSERCPASANFAHTQR